MFASSGVRLQVPAVSLASGLKQLETCRYGNGLGRNEQKNKQKRNSNICLAYVWTALCFHGNAFRFVFDQKCRDETRSFNNHISVKKPTWMAHASIKAKLFVIVAHLIPLSLSNRPRFRHVPSDDGDHYSTKSWKKGCRCQPALSHCEH